MTELDLDDARFDVDRASADPQSTTTYVILAGQRTGAALMCRQLVNAGLGVPAGYFEPLHQGRICRRFGLQPNNLDAYVKLLRQKRTTANGCFGMTLQPFQYVERPQLLIMNFVHDGTKFIHLYRANLLAQAISLHAARQTAAWGSDTAAPPGQPLTWEPASILSCLSSVVTQDRVLRTLLKKHRFPVLSLNYETYVGEQASALLAIAKHLEIEDFRPVEPESSTRTTAEVEARELAAERFIEEYGQHNHFGIDDICDWDPARQITKPTPPPSGRGAVINLQRRTDRRQQFLQDNDRVPGIEFDFVEGVDGDKVELRSLVEQALVVPGLQGFTQGMLGCSLSHRKVWQQASSRRQPVVAFEDDAILRTDFAPQLAALVGQLPADWDFVLLGYNLDSVLTTELVPGVAMATGFVTTQPGPIDTAKFREVSTAPLLQPLRHAYGLCGYLVSPQGADQLLEMCFPLANRRVFIPALNRFVVADGIDSLMNVFYRHLHAYCSLPPLVMSPNDKATSDASTVTT
jgi:GR25 family glycosyltransferase involved in LPS biosynthesis/LPS sulfotransferase NodH